MWRRLILGMIYIGMVRNTSTDVEKTCSQLDHYADRQKHLHGRGEDFNLHHF